MLSKFFSLDGTPREVNREQLIAHLASNNSLEDALYRDRELSELREAVFRGKSFRNVSFSKTSISRITFTECGFEDCLFIGTNFEDCEFHRCTFLNCNTYKAKFIDVYIDPRAFQFDPTYRRPYANVVLGTYQRLQSNLANMAQKSFAAEAEILFHRWQRYQLAYSLQRKWISPWRYGIEFAKNWVF